METVCQTELMSVASPDNTDREKVSPDQIWFKNAVYQ